MNMSFEQTVTSTVEAFIYKDFGFAQSTPDVSVDASIFGAPASAAVRPPAESGAVSELDIKKRVAAAYDRGVAAGRGEAVAEAERRVSEARQSIGETINGFEQEREQYFRRMEGEVVNLALAVARKILYREAQVDRVVLAGVVRVAMEKISGSGRVSLSVHPSSAEAWKQYLASQHHLAATLEIVEDGSLQPDQLFLKTSHGSTSLGLDTQFGEIERGFCDLVQQRQRSLQP